MVDRLEIGGLDQEVIHEKLTSNVDIHHLGMHAAIGNVGEIGGLDHRVEILGNVLRRPDLGKINTVVKQSGIHLHNFFLQQHLRFLYGNAIDHIIKVFIGGALCAIANGVLAVGARPMMAEHPQEVAEITRTADALVLNIANITDARMQSIKISAQTAQSNGIPFIIDAVGISGSQLRRNFINDFMKEFKPTAIKGNYSEIHALYDEKYTSSGIDADKKRLIDVTKECFYKAIEDLGVGSPIGNIGFKVQTHAESNGYSVVREMVGHGIGREMHEDPQVPNFGKKGTGIRLKSGMTLAIEPMINMGRKEIKFLSDGWGVATQDGKPSAHYENTILITDEGVEILTL